MVPSACRVALVVGTVLFTINHGNALLNNEMKRDRWFSAAITYCIPYMVNIHGQYTSRLRSAKS
ncbi:MAG: nitrate/nitrite transporter NrtS [Cyanobacteria bacterium J06626_14]